jgi:hypothetical protein
VEAALELDWLEVLVAVLILAAELVVDTIMVLAEEALIFKEMMALVVTAQGTLTYMVQEVGVALVLLL